jgi:hypothetical protein
MSFRRAVAFLSSRNISIFYFFHLTKEVIESTHVLRFDFSLAFTQAILDVFIFSPFMAPKAFDEVIEGFFEPIVPSKLEIRTPSH